MRRKTAVPALVATLVATLFGCRQSPSPTADLVIYNTRLIDGTGAVLEGVSIVISGDRIQSVSPGNAEVKAARRIDASGKTVLPGLIDVHVHLLFVPGEINDSTLPEFVAKLPNHFANFLANGVTTIKSTADDVEAIVDVRDRIRRGELLGPRLFVTGPALTAPGGHPAGTALKNDPWGRAHIAIELETEEEAREAVRRLARKNVDAIKFVFLGSRTYGAVEVPMPKLSPEIMKAIIDESHRQGLLVTAHTWDEGDAIAAVSAGIDGLEHGVISGRLTDDHLGSLMRDGGVSYVPTLRVYDTDFWWPVTSANLKGLSEGGVRIVLGSDTFNPLLAPPGWSTVDEMEWMARAGLTPAQIIQAATRNAAEHLGVLDQLGTVEPGKFADLIIVDGDPLQDISALRNVEIVIKAGEVVVETLVAAIAALNEGLRLADEHRVVEAIEAFDKAQALDSRLVVSPQAWNRVCWAGALWGHPAEAMEACDKAVTLSGRPGFRLGRGIARALTGDTEGAIEDFEVWVTPGENWRRTARQQAEKLEWIAALRRGENPFTPAWLKTRRETFRR